MEKSPKNNLKHQRNGSHSRSDTNLIKLVKTDVKKKSSQSIDPNYIDESADGSLNEAIWSEYQMKSKMFDYELIRQMPNFGIKKYKNSVYRGQLNSEGKRHGKGIMSYFDSMRLYEGDWVNDYREGEGYEKFSNLNEYRGAYKVNKPNGKGTYWWRNGDYYDGQWYEGVRQGQGKWISRSGETYEGEWHKGQASGYGTMTWSNGDKYVGGWKYYKKHGNGEDTYAEGNRFIGKYEDGLPQGYGEYYWADGSFYRGSFSKGHKEGQGIMFRKYQQDCKEKWVLYEGDFQNDARHGMGEIKWSNGNYYLGEFFNDERNGNGEMRWVDDSTYIGEWSKGKRHGWGTLKKPDGTIMTGVFIMNEFKGKEYIIAETQEENLNQSTNSTKLNLKKINDEENLRQIIFSGDGSRYHHKCKMESQNYNFNKDYFSRTMANKNVKQQGVKYLEFNKNKSTSREVYN
eukprot:403362762